MKEMKPRSLIKIFDDCESKMSLSEDYSTPSKEQEVFLSLQINCIIP